MIYWFKYMPEKIIQNKTLFPVVKNEWLRKNNILLGNILSIIIFIALKRFYIKGARIFATAIIKMFSTQIIEKEVLVISIFIGFMIISIIFIVIIHELLHMIVVLGKDDMSVTFSKGVIWVNTNADLSKIRQFIFISLPLIVLTVIPIFISFFVSDDIADMLRFISVFNFGVSSFDVLHIPHIILKPKNAVFWRGMYYIPQNKG